jgi:hypothetical protein
MGRKNPRDFSAAGQVRGNWAGEAQALGNALHAMMALLKGSSRKQNKKAPPLFSGRAWLSGKGQQSR